MPCPLRNHSRQGFQSRRRLQIPRPPTSIGRREHAPSPATWQSKNFTPGSALPASPLLFKRPPVIMLHFKKTADRSSPLGQECPLPKGNPAAQSLLPMNRLALLFVVLFATLGRAAERPNIIWLVGEDMGPELGCYGDTHAITPNMDRLAREGARFTRCFTHAPVCAPSRHGLITGLKRATRHANPTARRTRSITGAAAARAFSAPFASTSSMYPGSASSSSRRARIGSKRSRYASNRRFLKSP